jgi:hypothetical protein
MSAWLLPSKCNQINASKEVKGKEASKAAMLLLRLAISLIATIKLAESMTLSA